MSAERLNAALAVGDRVVLWIGLLGLIGVLGTLALRADRDPPSLIAPACVTVPTKATP